MVKVENVEKLKEINLKNVKVAKNVQKDVKVASVVGEDVVKKL